MSDREIEEYEKSIEERIVNIEEKLADENLDENSRKIYEDLLGNLKDEDFLAEQEAIKKQSEEAFEQSKTSIEESKEEIKELIKKHGLTWDKRIDNLLSTSEQEIGYSALSNIDGFLYVYSKLDLDDIVLNIKSGIPMSEATYKLEEDVIKSLDLNNDYYLLDLYVNYLNKEISKHNNLAITTLFTSINILSEKSIAPCCFFRGNIKFF